MQYFRGAMTAELIAVRVDAGEDVLESLGRVTVETQVAAGSIISGCGTLEHIRLEVPATLVYPSTTYAIEKQGPGQIVSAQGTVLSGAVELYLTVARRNEVHAGQVMAGTKALHSAEFTLLRAGNARWTRVPHPQSGVPLLQAIAPGAPPAVTLMGRPIDPNALALVPQELMRRHVCMPVARTADTLVGAMSDPNNPVALDDLRNATGLRIQTVQVDGRELVPALQQVLAGRG